jgi:Ala-tRNA(Pro) deacylase
VDAVRPTVRTCRYVLALIPGDRRPDLRRAAECACGRKAGLADRETAERVAGSVRGSVIPFSFHPDLELIVEEDLLRSDALIFDAARHGLSTAPRQPRILRVARPRTDRISEPDGT